jgi:glutamate 5-kinase
VCLIDDSIYHLSGAAGSDMGTGGIQTKIQAAQKCVDSGIQTLIVNNRGKTVFEERANGRSPGTLFKPNKSLDNARDNWLRHTLKVKGTIEIDQGAQKAWLEKGASLLPSGIIKVSGQFYQVKRLILLMIIML